jgi:4-hydroxybenzoate polyprenyltransferase/phosphoserine phosphatase
VGHSEPSPGPRREAPPAAGGPRPLCVDLDGTLVATDTLLELAMALAWQRPVDLLRVPAWLSSGRAALKARLAERVALEPSQLPYRAEVVEALRAARAEGRPCVLVTAADRRTAEAIAAHVGLFSEVLASDGAANLKGSRKAERLVERFGRGGFEYLGDAAADLPVWEAAGRASLVAARPALRRKVASRVAVERVVGAPLGGRARANAWRRALRVHQWVKNGLLLLPLLASHQLGRSELWIAAAWAFAAFSLCTSAIYVLNDLADLAADRAHPAKRRRPFASGALPIASGLVAAPLLLAGAAAIAAWRLPAAFAAVLAVYVLANLLYNFWLKRVAVADVILLAGLYSLRVVAGGVAVGVTPSPWLLAFCLFFFLNLAFLKRYVDLRRTAPAANARAPGRDYEASDLPLLASMGPAAGYMAVVILALYVQSENVTILYRSPSLLWLETPLVAFWISRAWLIAHRGRMADDPVAFAVLDPMTWAVGAAGGAIALLATWL